MYNLTISNENLYTEEQVIDFKGVTMLINTFTKNYGEPNLVIVNKSNCDGKAVCSTKLEELINK